MFRVRPSFELKNEDAVAARKKGRVGAARCEICMVFDAHTRQRQVKD